MGQLFRAVPRVGTRWHITEHQATVAILGLLLACDALVFLAAWRIPPGDPILALSAGLMLPVFVTLLVSYRRGWPHARQATVVLVTLALAFGIQEPYLTNGDLSLVMAPLIAQILAGPAWVLVSATSLWGILLVRAGGQGIYTNPVALAIWAMLVGGLIVSRLIMESSLREAQTSRREAEQQAAKLSQSEAQYRLLFDRHPEPMWVYDLATLQFLAVNQAAVRQYGYSHEEFLATTIAAIRPAEDVPKLLERVAQVRPTVGEPMLWRHLKKDGTLVHVEIRSHAQPFQGQPARLVMATDVTQRKLTEAQLRYQAQLLSAVKDAIVATDANTVITAWNPAAETAYGWPAEEVLGRPVSEVLATEYEGTDRDAAFRRVLESGEFRAEVWQRRKDGTRFPVESAVQALRDEHGQVTGLVAVNRDISERKAVEAALRASEARFRRYFELGLIGMAITSPSKGVLEVNDQLCAILGYERHELQQISWAALTHPDDLAADVDLFSRVMAGEIDGYELDKRWIRKDGQVIDTTIAVKCLRSPDGAVDYFVALLQDVTDRKRTQAALVANQRRFRALIENAPDGITLVDARGRVLFTSPSVSRILGYSPDEVVGQKAASFTHPDDLPALMVRIAELPQQPGETSTAQFRFRHRDGSWRWLESRLTNLMAEPAVQAIVFNYRDVTERKQAEQEIQRQLARLQALRTIDRAISASLDLRLTLSIFLEEVVAQLGVDAADVLLLDPHSQVLSYASGRGFRTISMQNARQPLGEGHAGRAALQRTLVHVTDLNQAKASLRHTDLLDSEDFVSYFGVPLIAKGEVKGVLEVFHRSYLAPDPDWQNFLEALAGQAAIALDNAALFERLQRLNTELVVAYDATIEGWSRALDLRDKETEGHSQRVTELTVELARAMGMSDANLVHVRRGALLHDMGKLGVPDSILLKPGKLTDTEWEVMRQHPTYAYEMLAPIAYLRPALDIPYSHHERWDGTGYPRGLRGEQIPLAARLFAVVDVWDALSSDRPYRPAWPMARVLDHIRSLAGSHFDPRAVDVFMQIIT